MSFKKFGVFFTIPYSDPYLINIVNIFLRFSKKMPLCQFRITPSNNGQRFTVPVSGKANIKVISLQYYDNNNNQHVPIQIRSDTLIFSYSSSPYLQALVGSRIFNAQFDTGKNEYSINSCDLQGAMTLQVVDQDTGLQPAHFGGCLLTLDIERINVGF